MGFSFHSLALEILGSYSNLLPPYFKLFEKNGQTNKSHRIVPITLVLILILKIMCAIRNFLMFS